MKIRVFAKTFASIIVLCSVLTINASSLKTEFSQERGFYGKSFMLTINTSKSGSIIKYTLDGSDPRISASAQSLPAPVSINVSPFSATGRAFSPAVIVRACAINNGDTSYVETNSYIFPTQVKFQNSTSAEMAPYWPSEYYVSSKVPPNCVDWMVSDFQVIDLETDRNIPVLYKSEFETALFDIPSISLVTDPGSLFNPDSGIYVNPLWSGKDWERAGSMEIIYPAGDGNVQANAGIRIRGGFSRQGRFGKHAFKLYFRKEYGTPKLEYPLFGNEGADEFERIDLKCSQNDGWTVHNPYATFLNDVFWRDANGAMKKPYTRSVSYHLYLNGIYWGLYQTEERAEANFAESYFGGTDDDYDAVKASGPSYDYPPYTLEATHGDLESSRAFWTIAKEGFTDANYKKVLGLNPDGTRNLNYPVFLDQDNLIDYMITVYFSANSDGPGDLNGGDNPRINNFFAVYNKKNPDGFKYIMHDAETTFGSGDITGILTTAGDRFETFNPMWLHQQLISNIDYKTRFSDRAYKHLFNNGVLTVKENILRYKFRADEIYMALVNESSRWGDLLTRNSDWLPSVNYNINTYFPARTKNVITHFKRRGWLGSIDPPSFDSIDFIFKGKEIKITKGGTFKLSNPNSSGTIYYTLDNSDPRLMGGGISTKAFQYSNAIKANKTVAVKARVKDGENWSALAERTITLNISVDLKITEINYNPAQQIIGNDTLRSKELEFIELQNVSGNTTDISGFTFTNGIKFTFPLNSLIPPKGYIVLASDTLQFKKLYGFGAFNQYNGNLSDEGETLILRQNTDSIILNFDYSDYEKDFDITDGSSYSLVYGKSCGTEIYNWRASANCFGSPGKDDLENCLNSKGIIKITEVLSNSTNPKVDAIELYNPADTAVNISNWYLSDNKAIANKWKIPENTVIASKNYLTIYEGHYTGSDLLFNENEFGSKFSISSSGEKIYLFSSDALQKVQSLICEYDANVTDVNESYGAYLNSRNESKNVLLDTNYFDQPNIKARQSPLIFNEITYKPATNNAEFIKLKNRSDSVLNLFLDSDSSITWKIEGVKFEFPAKTSINSGDSIYIVESNIIPNVFRKMMGLNNNVGIFNFNGHLENNGENISIMKPLLVSNETITEHAYVCLENVGYSNKLPWPEKANGLGYSIVRKNENSFSDDASNWTAFNCTFPIANAGSDFRSRLNEKVRLDGSGSKDPSGKNISYSWKIISKPSGSNAKLSDSTAIKPEITADEKGDYVFALVVSNGEKSSSESIVNMLAYENLAPIASLSTSTYNVLVNSMVKLNGASSYDYYYEPLGYNWEIATQPIGSNPHFIKTDTEFPEFTTDTKGKYIVELIVNDGVAYSSKVTLWVIASYPTEVQQNNLDDNIKIYPNPVKSILNIESKVGQADDTKITISDINGKILFTNKFNNPSIKINMDELNIKQGLYFINIQNGKYNINRKVVYTK